MPKIGQLIDRKVVITGGSRGIGAGCVRACYLAGAQVGFTYHKEHGRAHDLVYGEYSGVLAYNADTSDITAMHKVMEDFSTCGTIEGISGLVVNAGIYERRTIRETTLDQWEHTMKVNLDGAFIAVKTALPFMKTGSIVMISSQLAYKGSGSGPDYAASKAGILGLSRSLARELAPDIRVNTVTPGYIDTDLLSGDSEQKRRMRISEVPLARIGMPEDVAGAVAFLLSEDASYITGADIDINGGLYIH